MLRKLILIVLLLLPVALQIAEPGKHSAWSRWRGNNLFHGTKCTWTLPRTFSCGWTVAAKTVYTWTLFDMVTAAIVYWLD